MINGNIFILSREVSSSLSLDSANILFVFFFFFFFGAVWNAGGGAALVWVVFVGVEAGGGCGGSGSVGSGKRFRYLENTVSISMLTVADCPLT